MCEDMRFENDDDTDNSNFLFDFLDRVLLISCDKLYCTKYFDVINFHLF